jgi:hypothetical protein
MKVAYGALYSPTLRSHQHGSCLRVSPGALLAPGGIWQHQLPGARTCFSFNEQQNLVLDLSAISVLVSTIYTARHEARCILCVSERIDGGDGGVQSGRCCKPPPIDNNDNYQMGCLVGHRGGCARQDGPRSGVGTRMGESSRTLSGKVYGKRSEQTRYFWHVGVSTDAMGQ